MSDGLDEALFDLPPPARTWLAEDRPLPIRVEAAPASLDPGGGAEAVEDLGDLADAFAPPPTGGR